MTPVEFNYSYHHIPLPVDEVKDKRNKGKSFHFSVDKRQEDSKLPSSAPAGNGKVQSHQCDSSDLGLYL